MYCPKCGREMKDGARFCPGCGAENKRAAKGDEAVAFAAGGAAKAPAGGAQMSGQRQAQAGSGDSAGGTQAKDQRPAPAQAGRAVVAGQPMPAGAGPKGGMPIVSDGRPSKPAGPAKPEAGGKKRTAIIVVVVVVVLIIVGVVVGVNVKASSDAALKAEAEGVLQPWQDKADAVSTDVTDRAELLSRYNELGSLRAGIEAARAAGELKLSNGSECDLSAVTSLIEKKQSAIREWFAADYESRLKSSSLPDGASADSTSRDAAQSAASALAALKADLEAEKAVWGDPADSRYADLASRIEAQLNRANEVLAAITAAEEAAAAQAAAEAAAAAAASHTFECDYFYVDMPADRLPYFSDSARNNLPSNCVYARIFQYKKGEASAGFILYVLSPGSSKPSSAAWDRCIGTTSGGNPVWVQFGAAGDFLGGSVTLK